MRRFSIFVLVLILGLPLISNTPTVTTTVSMNNSIGYEADVFSEGSAMNITVTEDAGILNGSYASTNFNSDLTTYLGTGYDGNWYVGRSWFKFNLSEVDVPFYKATMYAYVNSEWSTIDEPTGSYYCTDDSWTASSITWNNQPSFSAIPTDVIDSPASPNMFISGNWYGWEITDDVRLALSTDKILTEVLKQTVEVGTQNALDYLARVSAYPQYGAYIELSFTNPTAHDLTTDGYSTSPLIDYIQDSTPALGWMVSDPDIGDYQSGYNVEVWDSPSYDGVQLWNSSSENRVTIYNSSLTDGNYHPFGMDTEVRLQMKYPSSELPRSGIVDKLYFRTIPASGTLRLEDFEIWMLMVQDPSVLGSTFSVNYDGRQPTKVFSMDLYEVSYSDHTLVIDVENIFMLNNYLNLIIEFRLMNNTADITKIGRVNAAPGSVAAATGAGSYTTDTAVYAVDRSYDLKIGFQTEEVFASTMTGANNYPFGVDTGTPGLFQIKYNQSVIDRAGIIDKIYFRATDIDATAIYENLTVSVVETPVIGPLSHTDFNSNYGGRTPTVVIDASTYEVRNLGYCFVLDFENTFYYSNTYDLLIEMQWDSLTTPRLSVPNLMSAAVCYRAWDVYWYGPHYTGNATAGYNLMIDFIDSETSVDYSGPTLVNNTIYYWRVQTCDSYGFWSDWAEQSFTYTPLTSGPSYDGPFITPAVVYVGTEVTVSINVTYFLGVSEVTIEFGGSSHAMAADGDTYSFSWTPNEAGTLDFTINMLSVIDTSTSVDGSVDVLGTGIGDITLYVIIIGAAVALVVVVVVIRMRGKTPT